MIHNDLCGQDFIVNENYVTTTTITTNAKSGALVKAQEVFDQLHTHDVVTWSAPISSQQAC